LEIPSGEALGRRTVVEIQTNHGSNGGEPMDGDDKADVTLNHDKMDLTIPTEFLNATFLLKRRSMSAGSGSS
jgi:hypothetical protein